MHRIEVLLVGQKISQSSLHILHLLKFNKQHVVQGRHVLLHVRFSDPAVQLKQNGVDSAVHLGALPLQILVILLMRLCVFLEPILAVSNGLF